MKYISLFAGIEAASVAWHDMGWQPVAFAEFDDFPSAVLAHHYPDVPNLGDITKVNWNEYKGKAELIVGGSPCQSFSVAGKRLGMDDPRGNLALHYLKIVRTVQPKWFIFENVPGLLSSDGGRDFATFLGEVAKCGYGFAYRVLDAQYFGVPQRRRRVFVVGHIDGDWRSAAAVLFESESLCRDSKTGKQTTESIASLIGKSLEREGGAIPTPSEGRRIAFNIDSEGGNSMKSSNPHSGVQEIDTASTLTTFPPSAEGYRGGNIIIDSETKIGALTTKCGLQKTDLQSVKEHALIEAQSTVFDWKNLSQTKPSTKNTDPVTVEGQLAVLDQTFIKTGFAKYEESEEKGATVCSQGGSDGSSTLAVQAPMQKGIIHCADVGPAMTASGPPYSRTGQEAVEAEAIVVQAPMHDPSPTLDASYGVGAGMRAGIERQCIGVSKTYIESDFAEYSESEKGSTLRCSGGDGMEVLVNEKIGVDIWNHQITGETASTMGSNTGIAIDNGPMVMEKEEKVIGFSHTQGLDAQPSTDAFPTLRAEGGGHGVLTGPQSEEQQKIVGAIFETTHVVRRLTPNECERLQGFPDNYTQIPYKGKSIEDCPQTHRYKALGNSMAVPVMKWIGQRVEAVDSLDLSERKASKTTVQKSLW
jgi:DNA-cytosine methyltransferase